jgi:hypothetical protein
MAENTAKLHQADANARFNVDLEKYRTGGMLSSGAFDLGKAGKHLQDAGLSDAPIGMLQTALREKATKHTINLSLLADLPDKLNNPVAVFDSDSVPNGKVILTETESGGKKIVAAVHILQTSKGQVVNAIKSIHGRNDSQLLAWVDKSLLRLVDKKRGGWLLDRAGRMQRQVAGDNQPPHKIIVYDSGEVKPESENNSRGMEACQ